MNANKQFNILGINIANLTKNEAAEAILQLIKSGQKHLVVTANPEIILAAKENPKYCQILQQASLVLADGFGLVLASYLLGAPLKKGRVTGVDLVWEIAKLSQNYGVSVFLAGSTQAILDKTTHNLASIYTNIKINGTYSALANDKKETHLSSELDDLSKILNKTNTDVLLLALGHPKQETWINDNLQNLNIRLGIGVGGAFDMISNELKRSPVFLRHLGLEWLWRLFLQPTRAIRIYRAIVLFPILIIKLFLIKVLRGT